MEAILTKNGRPVNGERYIISGHCIDQLLDGEGQDLNNVKIEVTSVDGLRYVFNRKSNKDKGLIIKL